MNAMSMRRRPRVAGLAWLVAELFSLVATAPARAQAAPPASAADGGAPAVPPDEPLATQPPSAAVVTAPESPAAASSDGASESANATNRLEKIVVTAQRRETNLQNTPIAITAFGPGLLQDRAIGSIRDLSGQIPNFSISRATISHTTQTFSLRGVGESDPIQEPVVAVYIDDVYQPRQLGSMLDFNDIERVEVLRGPQGTLYGRNSSAGALRVITSDPSSHFRTRESLTYGSYNTVKALASVSGPLSGDKLSASIAFLHNRRDGITYDPTLQRDVNRIDLDAGRAKLRWTPSERWELLVTLNGLIDRSDSRSYVPAAQPGAFSSTTSYSEVNPYQHLNQGGGSLRVVYKLSDELKLKSITSGGGFDLDPVYYDNDGVAALVQKNLIHYADAFATEELQLNGQYRSLTFATGLFYLHERFYVRRDGYSRKNAQPTDPVTTPGNYNFLRAHNVTTTDSFAIFGEVNLKVTDWLTLTGGVRETIEAKKFVFNNKVLDASGNVAGQSIAGDASTTWSAPTPKASLSFQWTPAVLQYVTYSRGFKSGGFDNRATLLALAERPFNPEYVNSYETGLKSELFGHRVRANLAGFYNDYKDLQVSFTDPAYPGSSIRGNAGQAHSAGFEAETDLRIPGGLALQGSFGYLYAVYDTYKNAGGPGVDADGNRLLNAPRYSFSGGATFDFPQEVFGSGSVRLGTDVQWASSAYSNALGRPQDLVPAQTFVNGSLTWTSDDEHFAVSLAARNLLNSQKRVSSTFTPNTGTQYFNFPDPRTVLVTLKYQL